MLFLFIPFMARKPHNIHFKYIFQIDIQIYLIFVESERVLVQSNAGTENRPKIEKQATLYQFTKKITRISHFRHFITCWKISRKLSHFIIAKNYLIAYLFITFTWICSLFVYSFLGETLHNRYLGYRLLKFPLGMNTQKSSQK